MYQAGLILEGGGMKGIYTAGVLDFFMDKEIFLSDCYGVSAGFVTCVIICRGKEAGLTVSVSIIWI